MNNLVLAVLCSTLSMAACAADLSVIRFGVDPTYPPFESKAPDGELVGFDIDLGNAICAQLKAKCVWVETGFDSIIPALKAKKFDGVLSAMTVNEQRKKQIAFSDRLYNSPSRLIARKGTSLHPTPESLVGKRVGVAQGSTQESYAKAFWEPKGVAIIPYQNQDLVYPDLLTGRIDATLTDAPVADVGFLQKPQGAGYEFAGDAVREKTILGEGISIGLRKEDENLRNALNSALAEMHKNGIYRAIEQRYFSSSLYD